MILETRFIFRDEMTAEQSWALLDWCRARGASEFTVRFMEFEGPALTFCEQVRASLQPHRRAAAERPHVISWANHPHVRPTELWELTSESILVLQSAMEEGLFSYACGDSYGWIEEPEVYRDGRLMLSVVSHEYEGVLTLTPDEHAEVAALGIRSWDKPVWL